MTERHIRLYNSKTRTKEDLVPVKPGQISMYVCGPTVYDRAHIGNARPVVVFDTLFRLLRHVYGAAQVTYVRNFTDVDDKINARAAETGRPIRDITDETIGWYHADMDALGALRPTHEPRATEFIGAMVHMIEGLIASGHAYEAEGHVLFDVRSYADYGKLSGRSIDDMIAGARVEVAPYKRDPMDFVLWKPSGADLPGWDSPWGRGRPGWHIECSAMSHELLGDTFDIHGGGIDLQFPHHENEIAQSCCAHPQGGFAKIWMHNEMLQVEGKKMSKSLGNFFTVRDLLDQGYPGEVIRYVYLGTHYSKPMDWTRRKAHDAGIAIAEMAAMLGKGGLEFLSKLEPGRPFPWVVDALSDDLNTSLALSGLRKGTVAKKLSDKFSHEYVADAYASQLLLGFDLKSHPKAIAAAKSADHLSEVVERAVVQVLGDESLLSFAEQLSSLREVAMATKDFSAVDAMKAALTAAGVEVRMSKAGVELLPGAGFDATKLDGLL